MRFLNGLLGAFAGLMVCSIFFNVLDGHGLDAGALMVFSVMNLVTALIGAGIIRFVEKPTWGWARYGVAGVYTAGSVQFLAFLSVGLMIAQAYGLSLSNIGFVAMAMVAVTTAISGAFAGIGYRCLTGVKAAA